ncbi:cupin domain-containing protein [Agrobacterium tumefaciens]|uniref:cupin domain-containing protein n=1 Tax=Agrobacterium tumefaciens TaxID=358 RepID=UPI0012B99C96|nr:cupin domain-containing protein [Agrobacterium tumefaciens]MQB07288.1 cupin domain-containing protein [Agrobacterium tumefaciens]
MQRFAQMTINGIEPDISHPEPDSLISGAPEFRHWGVDQAEGGVSAGFWESTPGKWHFANSHWEYCRILTGISVITEDGGEAYTVKAGDSFVLRAGFKGTWEVIETTRKDYVARD